MGDRINAGLFELMNNQHSFAAWASSGEWSGQQKLDIPQDTRSLTLGLTTYITSLALTGNKFFGEIVQLHNPKIQIGDKCTGDDARTCYQNETIAGGSQMFLKDSKEHDSKNPLDSPRKAMKDIVDNGWSTPELLLKGSFDCAPNGHWGGNIVNLKEDGTIDLSCTSRLDECFLADVVDAANLELWGENYVCCTNKVNGGCPVRNCMAEEA